MQPIAPWGVPRLINNIFWGGLWGALFGLIYDRLPGGMAWLKGLIYGLLIVVVSNWILLPLIRAQIFGQPNQVLFGGLNPQRMLASVVIVGGFGLGLGIIYGLIDASRRRCLRRGRPVRARTGRLFACKAQSALRSLRVTRRMISRSISSVRSPPWLARKRAISRSARRCCDLDQIASKTRRQNDLRGAASVCRRAGANVSVRVGQCAHGWSPSLRRCRCPP